MKNDREICINQPLLQHDNARLHSIKMTKPAIHELSWEIIVIVTSFIFNHYIAFSVIIRIIISTFIYDVQSSVDHHHCKHHLYADDLQIYILTTPDSLNDAIQNLNEDLESISAWARKFGLTRNARKSQAILVGHQRLLRNITPAFPVKLNDTIIPFASCVKNLGVYFDTHLNWNNQVTHITKKVLSILHSLNSIRKFLPVSLKKILVETLVMLHFDYFDFLLTDLNVNQFQKLQRVHNSCVRFVCDIRRTDHITPSFQTLNWLRLNERRNFHFLVLLFQVLHTSTPTYLASRFSYLSSYHNLFTLTQNSRILAIPTHKISSYSSSYTISLSRLWYTLPSDIRDCRNLVAFKSKLIKHFLTS
ncbi:hypothetical protein ANN_02140 [Periplaneta americana]|uniref:Reverse transcriptase domain-containing protein n=1 Tax=Periplaneta americana TaxID=6978 RepID=A0ABQ8TYI4_PERAM|nr:hypothetical protein ANN_02140 [Periplaneta americana]